MRRLWTALKHHVDSLYDSARVSGDPRWNTVVTELFRNTHKIWSDIALATRSSRAQEADEIGHDGGRGRLQGGAGAGGRTRTGTVLANRGIFVPLRLSPPCQTRSCVRPVCGLDYTFTLALSRVRRCPSSLYTFASAVRPVRLARDCLLAVSPNLSSSTPQVSPRALNF